MATFLKSGASSLTNSATRLTSGGATPPVIPFELSSVGGSWCWFADPRAIYYNDHTYYGFVTLDGDIYIQKYTHSTKIVSGPFDLHPTLETDDHDNPSLLVRDSDKRILAAYSKHGGNTIYLRISTNPEDISAWGGEASLDAQIGGEIYTYPSLIQLLGEVDDPIYMTFRDHHDSIDEHPAHLGLSKSTDGGATWAAETLVAVTTYHKTALNGDDRIDFAGANHPQDPDDHGIYHFYYQGGNYYKTDGTQIMAALPMATSDMTQVYDGSSVKGWIWDIAIDGTGKPVIVFATFPTEWTDHRYNYARWTGAAWDVHEITAAGGGLYGAQPAYSGGVVLDHANPNIVYLSKVVSGQWEIYKYVTADGGATWTATAITSASSDKNIRPVSVRNAASDLKFMWFKGAYTTYTNFDMDLWGSGS